MTRARSRGMTLIEVLISVSLLSVLSVSVLLSLRVGINTLDKTNTILMANRRAVSVERILAREIAGLMPVAAECPQEVQARPVRVPFFEGKPGTMRFVSSYSLQEASRGAARVLEFHVIPGEEGNGVRLVVNEFLYTGPQSAGGACLGMRPEPELGVVLPIFRPPETGPASFVLADKLAYCRFSYREKLPPPALERWVPQWLWPRLPSAVRIDLEQSSADPSRAPLVPMTIPIRVDREVLEVYSDVQ